MSSPPIPYVVLVPGLSEHFDRPDRPDLHFSSRTLLNILTSYLELDAVPFDTYEHDQPTLLAALMRANLREQAGVFNAWLSAPSIRDRIASSSKWLLVGHSAGGILAYNWLALHAAIFSIPPTAVYILDAAHTISDDKTPILPGIGSGVRRRFPVRGERPVSLVDKGALMASVNNHNVILRVYSAGKDTFLEEDTCLSPTSAYICPLEQLVISGAGHNGICSNDDVIRSLLALIRST